jgi:hypothetical protein
MTSSRCCGWPSWSAIRPPGRGSIPCERPPREWIDGRPACSTWSTGFPWSEAPTVYRSGRR